MSEVCGIILAAGEGKRMKSNLPKVLSRVLDKRQGSGNRGALRGGRL